MKHIVTARSNAPIDNIVRYKGRLQYLDDDLWSDVPSEDIPDLITVEKVYLKPSLGSVGKLYFSFGTVDTYGDDSRSKSIETRQAFTTITEVLTWMQDTVYSEFGETISFSIDHGTDRITITSELDPVEIFYITTAGNGAGLLDYLGYDTDGPARVMFSLPGKEVTFDGPYKQPAWRVAYFDVDEVRVRE